MIGVPAHFGNSIYKKLAFVVNFFFVDAMKTFSNKKRVDFGS